MSGVRVKGRSVTNPQPKGSEIESGTQEKKSMRKFAAESNLMLSNVESMEVEQSVKNAE